MKAWTASLAAGLLGAAAACSLVNAFDDVKQHPPDASGAGGGGAAGQGGGKGGGAGTDGEVDAEASAGSGAAAGTGGAGGTVDLSCQFDPAEAHVVGDLTGEKGDQRKFDGNLWAALAPSNPNLVRLVGQSSKAGSLDPPGLRLYRYDLQSGDRGATKAGDKLVVQQVRARPGSDRIDILVANKVTDLGQKPYGLGILSVPDDPAAPAPPQVASVASDPPGGVYPANDLRADFAVSPDGAAVYFASYKLLNDAAYHLTWGRAKPGAPVKPGEYIAQASREWIVSSVWRAGDATYAFTGGLRATDNAVTDPIPPPHQFRVLDPPGGSLDGPIWTGDAQVGVLDGAPAVAQPGLSNAANGGRDSTPAQNFVVWAAQVGPASVWADAEPASSLDTTLFAPHWADFDALGSIVPTWFRWSGDLFVVAGFLPKSKQIRLTVLDPVADRRVGQNLPPPQAPGLPAPSEIRSVAAIAQSGPGASITVHVFWIAAIDAGADAGGPADYLLHARATCAPPVPPDP